MAKANYVLLFVVLLFITSCKSGMPEYPDVKDFYLVTFDQLQNPICIKYEIVSNIPFKIANPTVYQLSQCDFVGGFKPEDVRKITNWTEEVKTWSETKQVK